MQKRAGGLILSLFLLFSLVLLYCAVPEGPDDPSKTSVKVVTRTSEDDVFDYPIEISAGDEIQIGAAIYLPANITSIEIKVVEQGTTTFSENYSEFETGYYDTVWLDYTFSTAGVKTIIITPQSSLNLSAITSSITVSGGSDVPEGLKWIFDTIPYSMNTNSQISLDLSKLVSGIVTENTIFTLQSGSPESDAITESTFEYSASASDIGTHYVNIEVSDNGNNSSDTLVILLTVEDVGNDETPPLITLISPPDTQVTFDGDTYTIALLCSDASGVASVTAAIGEFTISAELLAGFYQISISSFSDLDASEIVITAVDSSENANTSQKTIHINSIGQTYSVTYMAPGEDIGGEVPSDNQLYTTGVKVEVAGNTGNLEKVGYTFIGWNTAEDGSEDVYAAGEFFTMGTEDIILYAQWTDQATHTVTYNGNGNTAGETPADDNHYINGSTVTVKGNTGSLEKEGATFTGWNTREDGSGTTYAAEETFIVGEENVTLYAQWSTESTYSVTYNGNGNTDGNAPVDANNYIEGATVTVKSNSGSLVKTGFSFIGWNIEADGNGNSYTPGVTFTMSSSDVTLYAQWSSNPTFSVIYEGNENTGGEVPEDDTEYEEGMTVTVKDNTGNLVKTGSTFTGWNTSADGSGSSYATDATITMAASDITLYAQWSSNPTFSITYDGNGNTSGTVPTDGTFYEEGMTVTIKDNTGNLLKTGSTFTGWNTAEDGSGSSYTAGANLEMGTSDLILYAQWSTNPTFTVTYNGNGNTGGTVPTDGTYYEEGMTVAVKGNTGNLVNTGFTFSGWNTAANGSGTGYEPSATLEMGSENVILYAQWQKNTYVVSVTTDGNGTVNDQPTLSLTVEYGEDSPAITASPTGNYHFTGWSGDVAGTTNPLTVADVTSNVAVQANFAINGYAVTFTAGSNGSITGTATQSVEHGGNCTSVTATPETGYHFTGWSGDATGTTNPLTVTDVTSDMTIQANFAVNDYTVTFTAGSNGSIAGTATQSVEHGGNCTSVTATSETGYHFTGWSGDATGTANPLTVTDVTSDMDIQANFAINGYTVTFTAGSNGSITGTATQSVEHGGNCTSVTATPATGYYFSGWSGDASGSTNPLRITGVTSDMDIQASFAVIQYTVNVTTTGSGTVNDRTSLSLTVNHGSSTGAITAAAGTGYEFTGWTGDLSSTSNPLNISSVTSNMDIEANFTLLEYRLNVESESGGYIQTPSSSPAYVNHGVATTIVAAPNSGYEFSGWTVSSGTATIANTGNASTTVTLISGDATVSAQWSQSLYTVTYNANGGTGTAPTDGGVYTYGEYTTAWANSGKLIQSSSSFVGWNTMANGSGTSYACGQSIRMTGNVTLYARYSSTEVMDNSGNLYQSVEIGGVRWLAQNLKTTRYNDGGFIPNVTDSASWWTSSTPAYCWYNNSVSNKIYGAFYNGYAVMTGELAPAGWRVATNEDWSNLREALSPTEACEVKETGTSHWTGNECATNSSGFTALGNGQRHNSDFEGIRNMATWWTSTEYFSGANMYWYIMSPATTGFASNAHGNVFGFGVRCVKE